MNENVALASEKEASQNFQHATVPVSDLQSERSLTVQDDDSTTAHIDRSGHNSLASQQRNEREREQGMTYQI